jgi:hypothetical protein
MNWVYDLIWQRFMFSFRYFQIKKNLWPIEGDKNVTNMMCSLMTSKIKILHDYTICLGKQGCRKGIQRCVGPKNGYWKTLVVVCISPKFDFLTWGSQLNFMTTTLKKKWFYNWVMLPLIGKYTFEVFVQM